MEVVCLPSPPPVPSAAIPLAPTSTLPLAPAFIPSPPAGSVTTTSVQPSIDLDNLDETLRMPFYQELLPFTERLLGEFEWIAFEEVLCHWSTVIKDVVSAHHRRPPNPTAQWAHRRRGRYGGRLPGARSPSPAQPLPPDPSLHYGEQPTLMHAVVPKQHFSNGYIVLTRVPASRSLRSKWWPTSQLHIRSHPRWALPRRRW